MCDQRRILAKLGARSSLRELVEGGLKYRRPCRSLKFLGDLYNPFVGVFAELPGLIAAREQPAMYDRVTEVFVLPSRQGLSSVRAVQDVEGAKLRFRAS